MSLPVSRRHLWGLCVVVETHLPGAQRDEILPRTTYRWGIPVCSGPGQTIDTRTIASHPQPRHRPSVGQMLLLGTPLSLQYKSVDSPRTRLFFFNQLRAELSAHQWSALVVAHHLHCTQEAGCYNTTPAASYPVGLFNF